MIDRSKFKKAFEKISSLGQGNPFLWRGQVKEEFANFGALQVNNVGHISLPLTDDVTKLAKEYPLRKSGTHPEKSFRKCCHIDASEITIIPKQKSSTHHGVLQDVTYSILEKMFNVSFENMSFNVELRLDKLIICADAGPYQAFLRPISDHNGEFGTLLLKLPVSKSKTSGKVVIYDGTRKIQLEAGRNSCFSAIAITGPSSSARKRSFLVEAGSNEITAIMVFHFIWKDHLIFGRDDILPPTCFTELLISTNEIKTALIPWQILSTITPQQHSAEQTKFLCLPVNGRNRLLSVSNLSAVDMIVLKSLVSITFLDCMCVAITAVSKNQATKDSQAPRRALKIVKATHSPHQFFDDIQQLEIVEADNIISSVPISSESKMLPAIVIRPRNMNHVLVWKDNVKSKLELFAESLTGRLNLCSEQGTLENSFVSKTLIKELEQIVHFLNQQNDATAPDGADIDKAKCRCCFFTNLFYACLRLKTENLALEILKVLPEHANGKPVFDCQCNIRDVSTYFAKFVCLAKGWQKCPDIMKKLINQMITDGQCSVVCEVALRLLQNGNVDEAHETSKLISEAMKTCLSSAEKFRQLFHRSMVPLALCLNGLDEPKEEMLALLKTGMQDLDPSELTELIQHLGQVTKEESLNCSAFIAPLAAKIVEIDFLNFTTSQVWKIMKIFRSLRETGLVRSFWKELCLHCIRVHHTKPEGACLYCAILREDKSTAARDVMIAELSDVEEFKDGTRCSLSNIGHRSSEFTVKSCGQYIQFILLMTESGQLAENLVVEQISVLLHRLTPNIMDYLVSTLFDYKQMGSRAPASISVRRDVFVKLLQQICRLDADVVVNMTNVNAILYYSARFALLGEWISLDLLKNYMNKFNSAIATSRMTHARKVALVIDVLTSKPKGLVQIEQSSQPFRRDVFHHLICECLHSLERDVHNRPSIFTNVFFLLMAQEETGFADDATPAFVCQRWLAVVKNLTFFETVIIAQSIFTSAKVNRDGSNLKKITLIWKVFKEICSSLVSKRETSVVLTNLKMFTSPCFVLLMQCLMCTGEEEFIAGFNQFLNEVHRSVGHLADVHSAIIRNKRTLDLATSSAHATLAFNGLVDQRIDILNKRLNDCLKNGNDCIGAPRNPQQRSTTGSSSQGGPLEPASKTRKITVEDFELGVREEIADLQALRKKVLLKILLSQPRASSNS